MLAALLLAAGALASRAPARSIDQRVSLLEARQMLESQALWGLQSTLHPDALRAVADIEAHVAQDRERDEALRAMNDKVATLEQRLATLELAMGDRAVNRAVIEGSLKAKADGAQIGEPTIKVQPAPVAKAHLPKAARSKKKAAQASRPAPGTRFADAQR